MQLSSVLKKRTNFATPLNKIFFNRQNTLQKKGLQDGGTKQKKWKKQQS